MSTAHTLPRAVREVEHAWIPMPDGCRLAARLWLPADAERAPVPAILEYIPYRKRDLMRRRDEPMHGWFAAHGYAAVRVDVRGSGDSDGLLLDEYSEAELRDGADVIRWIAAQPWCSGAVGMLGKSWGGFNALQVAALRPPELRAVISACSTDDRYADDAHYMGGCLLLENLSWGSVLFTLNTFPPDPEIAGASWRAQWEERLRAAPLFPATWLEHQRRDAYWRRGSVCEDFGAIACPVYAVGGFADAYTDAVPRLLAGLSVPRKGLIGPWAHRYPHEGAPGPAIGFLQEALRWFDRWLLGRENGIEVEPAYRAWMQAGPAPEDDSGAAPQERAGRWVAEVGWPSPRVRARELALRAGRLVPPGERGGGADEPLRLRSPQTTGLEAGAWCPFGSPGELPGDQRADDAGSLVFDTEPLREELEILGAPRLRLLISADRPLALLAARLCEVEPGGRSTRVAYGLSNLAHRAGHERPAPLIPGERCEVSLALGHAAHAFARGHRVRLALSTAYWPIAWPSPEAVELAVFPSGCRLELPERPPRPEDEHLRPFEPPEAGPPAAITPLSPERVRRTVERDLRTGETLHTLVVGEDAEGGIALERIEAIGLVLGHAMVQRLRIHPGDPLSARAEIQHRAVFSRGAWRVEIETEMRLASTRTELLLDARIAARESGAEVAAREWRRVIPRDHL